MKLDYSKIKLLEKSMNSERAMASKIGMSAPGYSKMMKNRSCKVETLVTIAKAFNKPLMYFFEIEDEKNVMYEPGVEIYSCPDCLPRVKKIREQEKEIYKLKDKLSDLNEKYTSCLEQLLGKKGQQSKNSA